jgi:homoserine kinase
VHDILRDAGASGVALSGAGPTVIGLVAGDTDELAHRLAEQVAERAADAVRDLGTRRAPQALRIDRAGARVL